MYKSYVFLRLTSHDAESEMKAFWIFKMGFPGGGLQSKREGRGRTRTRMCFHVVLGWWTQTLLDLQRGLWKTSQNHLLQGLEEDLSTGSWLSLIKGGLMGTPPGCDRVPMSVSREWEMPSGWKQKSVGGIHQLH